MPEPRLDLLKALGDNTRYAIYLEIARSPIPLTTTMVAEVLDLHPNTVRPHLERMREVGLLDVTDWTARAISPIGLGGLLMPAPVLSASIELPSTSIGSSAGYWALIRS